MSHFLPIEEIKKIEDELWSAVTEFSVTSKQLEQEEAELEKDMTQALEKQKIDELKKKLAL